MSRNASGSYSLPVPETPFLTRTVINSTDMNNVMSDIGTELTDSLSRSGKGAMTAPLQLPDGSSAAPSLTFNSDTDTGLYRVGANTLGFAAGGAVKAELSTSQLLTVDGALATPALSFISDTNTGVYRAGADDLRIVAGGVAIATATTKLSIAAATAATGGTRQDALSLTNGDLDLSAVAYPTSTTAVSNRLTPANLCKAWVVFQIVGGGGSSFTVTVQAAFNITSVAFTSSTTFTVTFASAFSSATSYGPVGQVLNGLIAGGDQLLVNPTTRNTTTMVAGITASKTGGAVNLNASSDTFQVMIVFFGNQ